jgi:uncharacterized protein (TIGR02453 family)
MFPVFPLNFGRDGALTEREGTAMPETRFSTNTFRFLVELSLNNTRSWFETNKPRYEALVREPALAFIQDLRPHLKRISPHLVADDRKVGGSLIRVHRDVRFSRDKSPYKTNIGIQFRHEVGKDVHAPGLYVHIAPDNCFLGCGVWHPDAKALRAIREHIRDHSSRWQSAVGGRRFRSDFALDGASLTRPPKGFEATHPLIDDLKRTDFIGIASLMPREVVARDFPRNVARRLGAGKPLMAFLCEALELAF